jgi:hypothetical protein
MLRLNVFSGTTVVTILGRWALRAAQLSPKAILSPRTNTKTRNATPRHLQIGLDQPPTLKSPTHRRKAGGDGGAQLKPSRASNTETINSKIPKDE